MSYSYRIEQAIRAAALLHKDQTRRGKIPFPYVTHLYAVSAIVSDYTDDEDVIIAALLHDTLEDTGYTPEELEDDFGRNVTDIVLGVTEPQPDGEAVEWKDGKKNYLNQLGNAPEGSLIVAAGDKIHNMRCIIEEYYDNHKGFIKDFGGSLNDRLMMYQEISNLLNRKLDNPILSEFNHVFSEYKKFIEHAKKETA